MNKVKAQLNGLNTNTQKMASGMTKAFKGVAMAIAALGIGKIIRDSITEGMDAIEAESMFSTALGGYADQARKWSQELNKTLGLSGYDLRKNVATYFDMTTAMGLAGDTALEVSEDITLLANDIASFKNLSTEEAYTKLRGALTGESEGMKALGYIVDETTVKQTAYKYGLAQVGQELTNSQKVYARYLTIMDSTKNAQGDLARTINSPANQLRMLKSQLKDVMINLGMAFMPIVQIVLPILNQFAQGLSVVTQTISQFMGALFGTSQTQSAAASTANTITIANDKMGESYDNAAKEAKKAQGILAGFDEVNQLQMTNPAASGEQQSDLSGGINTNPLTTSLDDVANSSNGISEKMKRLAGAVKEALKPLASIDLKSAIKAFEGLKEAITPFTTTIFNGLYWAYQNIFVPLAEFTIENILPNYINTLTEYMKLWNKVAVEFGEIFKKLWETFLKPVAEYTGEKFVEFWSKLNQGISEFKNMVGTSQVFKDLKNIIEKIGPILADITKKLVDLAILSLEFIWENKLIDLKNNFKNLEDAIGFVAAILNGDFSKAWGHLKDLLIDNKVDNAKAKFEELRSKFDDLIAKIKEWASLWAEKVQGFVETWNTKISEWWTNNVTPWFTKEKWDGILVNIGTSLATALTSFVRLWNTEIPKWWKDNVSPWFTLEKWKTEYKSIVGALSSKLSDFNNEWNTKMSSWWTKDVKPWFTLDKWKELGTNIKDGIVYGFQSATAAVIGVLNSIISAFEGLVNSVIGGINKIIAGYNSVATKTLLPTLPTLDAFRVDKIPIPKLARGGIVDSPTLAMIGEAGKEAVVPLENTSFVDKLASALGTAVMAAMQFAGQSNNSQSGDTVLQLDGTIFGRLIRRYVESEGNRIGTTLITEK